MSMQDPISDMLTRVRNAQMAHHVEVEFPASNIKLAIANVLQREGYIERVELIEDGAHKQIKLVLRYHDGQPVINELKRISRPGLRRFSQVKDIPIVRNGYGVTIVSTVVGVLTDREAREKNLGGEVLATVF